MAKILVVEDYEGLCLLYRGLLDKDNGHETIFAHDADEAIEILNQHKDIDLVILDGTLQNYSGRSHSKYSHGIIVASYIRDVIWAAQEGTKRPLFVTAGFVPYEAEGAVRVFAKAELINNLLETGSKNWINKILLENGIFAPSRSLAKPDPSPAVRLENGG